MNINEIALHKALKENAALRRINKGLFDAVNESIDDGTGADLVWLTRDELKGYSELQQAGGISAIKANAVQEFANIHCGDCTTEYQAILNGQASDWAHSILKAGE